MATHDDYDIDDQTGSSMLTDLNNLLDALRSNSSNTVVPTSFIDYQFWVDTTTNILKMDAGAVTIDICNIDTGLFFGVASTTDADALDGLTTSSNADSTNVILRRDANGAVTGNLRAGWDITGDAQACGAANQDADYFFDSANLLGVLPNTETAGGNMIAAAPLQRLTSGTASAGADYVYFRPLRSGGYTAKLYVTDTLDVGTMRVMGTGDSTQTTATSGLRYYIANTGGVTDWSAVMTGATSVAVGDIYTCGTTSASLDTDLSGTGCAVIQFTDWAMATGTVYSQNVSVNNGGAIIFDLTSVNGLTADKITIETLNYGWSTELANSASAYETYATRQLVVGTFN